MGARILVFVLSLSPSATAILYAIFHSHCPADAERGGAIGTALALGFVFLSRNFGMEVHREARNRKKLRKALAAKQAAQINPLPLPTIAELAAMNKMKLWIASHMQSLTILTISFL
jgi:hypothetical protein